MYKKVEQGSHTIFSVKQNIKLTTKSSDVKYKNINNKIKKGK